jgi:DNA/RNA-binding domain of Phe-tRNA-synthetase-like protein
MVGGLVAAGLAAAAARLADAPVDDRPLVPPGLTVERLAADPIVADWRAAIQACGLKPSTYKSSPEQLARRVLKSGPLHTPLAVVDAYCAVSARHLAPLGAYDVSHLPSPEIHLRLARPDTDVFHPLGAKDGEMPLTPQVAVYVSADTVICWAYNCRDSRDTCLAPDTEVGLFVGEAVTERQHEPLRAALDELAGVLRGAGATVGPAVYADASTPTVAVLG